MPEIRVLDSTIHYQDSGGGTALVCESPHATHLDSRIRRVKQRRASDAGVDYPTGGGRIGRSPCRYRRTVRAVAIGWEVRQPGRRMQRRRQAT